jgi:UDP-GlcNAc:undecaprenyl-phosphate GlcNAc-1-phosphate transferase
MLTFSQILILFFASFALVGLLTPLMRKLALKIDFVDIPNSMHKSHIEPIPYLGGVAIILGTTVVTFSALATQDNLRPNFWTAASVFVPALVLAIVGLIDDKKMLEPLPRFIVQLIAGIFTAIMLIITSTVGNPTGNSIVDAVITVFWIIGITNSINFFDNLDGGAAGAVAASSLGLFLISHSNGQYLISASALTILAAMLGFLIWNKSPARIYMGDAGALFLGTILAILTIRLDPRVDSKLVSFAIPLLLLAVPILDTCVAIFSRVRRGKSIFEGGKDHLSHRLMRKGFGKKQSAYLLWSLTAIFSGAAATLANVESSLFLVWMSAFFWLALLLTFLRSSDE